MLFRSKPHLQFFPLAIFAAIYFLNEKINDVDSCGLKTNRDRIYWVHPFWIIAIAIAFVALIFGSPWLAHFCAIVIVGVWAFAARPYFSSVRILGICGLLGVTLPPPFGWDRGLIQGLQALSSIACSRLMDLTGIIHVRRGNIIEVASKQLFVEEACSGVDSQYALMAVAGVLLLLGRAHLPVALITIVTVPIWAILGNLLRIYLIVIGLEWLHVDLSIGLVHTFLGLIVFVFTAWVHWSSVQFLNYVQASFFSKKERSDRTTEVEAWDSAGEVKEDSVETNSYGIRWAWSALPLGLLLLFPESIRALIDFHATPDLPSISESDSERFPGGSDLAPLVGSQLIGFNTAYRERNDMLGQHSRIWELRNELGRMTVCLDFPFRGWHPLWECYINSGWRRLDTVMIGSKESATGTDPNAAPYYESLLENDLGDIAVLHFSLFDEEGSPYTYEGSFAFRKHADRWMNTLWTRRKHRDRITEPVTYQFQQLAYTNARPDEAQLQELRGLFVGYRRQVLDRTRSVLIELNANKGRLSESPNKADGNTRL